jgi:hypothetical protein
MSFITLNVPFDKEYQLDLPNSHKNIDVISVHDIKEIFHKACSKYPIPCMKMLQYGKELDDDCYIYTNNSGIDRITVIIVPIKCDNHNDENDSCKNEGKGEEA